MCYFSLPLIFLWVFIRRQQLTDTEGEDTREEVGNAKCHLITFFNVPRQALSPYWKSEAGAWLFPTPDSFFLLPL